MQFEYHSFEVESYLKQGIQPVFMLSPLDKTAKYHTLTNPETGEVTITTGISDAVRIPVFALVTSEPSNDLSFKKLTHGSLLTGLGFEIATKFVTKLTGGTIERVIVILATNCHELANHRYRAYLGVTVEIKEWV
jgi:hypothetical protein